MPPVAGDPASRPYFSGFSESTIRGSIMTSRFNHSAARSGHYGAPPSVADHPAS